MPRMIYNLQPMLQVRDLRESIAFYTDVLGFKLDGTFPEDAPTWAGLTSGNARIMITALDAAAAQPSLTGVIYMYPDDVDAVWDRLKDVATVVEPIETRVYGMRDFSIRDPNGYMITFGQSVQSPDHEHPHGEHEHSH
jgi:uncharacterized glyoxalase superfamily protein PhnB